MADDLTTTIAFSGFPVYGGTSYAAGDERHRELQGTRRDVAFSEMVEGDSLIAVSFTLLAEVAAQVAYTFSAADSSDPESVAIKEDFDAMWKALKTPWLDVVKNAIRGVAWGWSAHELVAEMRDGKPTLTDLFHIRQDSRYAWKWDDGGREVTALEQLTRSGQHAVIPMGKCLHFVPDSSTGDPEGRPMLRPLYRDYRSLVTVSDYMVVGVGKDATGMVVATVPVDVFSDSLQPGSANYTAARSAVDTIQKNTSAMQRGAREGLVFPAAKDADGKDTGYGISLLQSGGGRQFDHLAIARYFEGRIARGLLTQFLLLGSDKAGSFALSSDQTEILGVVLGGIIDSLVTATNEQVVRTVCDLRGIPEERRPRLVHGPLDKPDLEKLGSYVERLFRIGTLTPSPELENHLRNAAELPATDATQEAM